MANAWLIEPLQIAAANASSAAAGTQPAFVGNDYAGIVWQSGGEAAPTLTLDLGRDREVDTLALFGLTGFGPAHQATVRLATAAQGSSFGAGAYTEIAADAVLAGAEMPRSGRGNGLIYAEGPAVGRYLRIGFAGLGGAVQVARAVVGRRIVLERNFDNGGALGVRDLGTVEFSRRGVLQRARGEKLRTAAITFAHVRKDEVEKMTLPLIERLGNTEMLALVLDPSPHAQRQNRCYFGPLVGDLANVQRNAAAWEAKLNVVSRF